MSAWFFNHKGRLQGPLKKEEIVALITSGKLGPDDLLYEEGQTRWTPLSEIPTFAAQFGDASASSGPDASGRIWILLQRAGKGFKQLGPYTAEEIREQLKNGKAKYADYVWREGMREWYRVHTFPELIGENHVDLSVRTIPPERKPKKTKPPEELKNVVELKYEAVTATDLPAGASGPDLVQTQKDPRDTKKEKKPLRPPPPRPLVPVKRSGGNFFALTQAFLRGDPMRISLAGLFIVLLGGFGFLAYSKLGSKLKGGIRIQQAAQNTESLPESRPAPEPQPKPKPQPVAETPSAADTPTAPEPIKPPEPPPEPRKPPSYVKLQLTKSGGLLVQTDASSHFSTRLQFTSEIGSVLGRNSYFRTLGMGKDREISLAELRWPAGIYQIEAIIEDKTAKLKGMVGNVEDFSQQLREHKKRLTYDFIEERIAYIRVASRLKDQAEALALILQKSKDPSSWKRDYSVWRRGLNKINQRILDRIGPKSRNVYVLAPLWLELKEKRRDLASLGTSLQKTSFRSTSEAAKASRDIVKDFAGLEEEGQRVSLW